MIKRKGVNEVINIKNELDEILLEIGKKPDDIIDLHILHKRCYNNTIVYNHYNEIPKDKFYDNGFGGQELYGNVVFTDGTWLERGEYDGLEWWDHKSLKNVIHYINESRKKELYKNE